MKQTSAGPSPMSRALRWLVVGLLVIGTLWLLNRLAAQAGAWLPHAVSHLSASIVGALLWLGAVKLPYRHELASSRVGQLGEQVFLTGTALFTLSQVVEALSAIIEYPNAGLLHTTTSFTTILGLLILLLGVVLLVWTAVARRVPPRWGLPLVALLAAFGLFVLFAAVFGLG